MGEIVAVLMAVVLLVGMGIVIKDVLNHADKSSPTKDSSERPDSRR